MSANKRSKKKAKPNKGAGREARRLKPGTLLLVWWLKTFEGVAAQSGLVNVEALEKAWGKGREFLEWVKDLPVSPDANLPADQLEVRVHNALVKGEAVDQHNLGAFYDVEREFFISARNILFEARNNFGMLREETLMVHFGEGAGRAWLDGVLDLIDILVVSHRAQIKTRRKNLRCLNKTGIADVMGLSVDMTAPELETLLVNKMQDLNVNLEASAEELLNVVELLTSQDALLRQLRHDVEQIEITARYTNQAPGP